MRKISYFIRYLFPQSVVYAQYVHVRVDGVGTQQGMRFVKLPFQLLIVRLGWQVRRRLSGMICLWLIKLETQGPYLFYRGSDNSWFTSCCDILLGKRFIMRYVSVCHFRVLNSISVISVKCIWFVIVIWMNLVFFALMTRTSDSNTWFSN